MTSIKLSSSLKTIGDEAFGNCQKITVIELPDTIESLGNFVFAECSSLTKVVLHKSLTNIGQWIFSYCDSEIVVEYDGTIEEWKKINGFSNIQEIDIICSDGTYRWYLN
jgi:hypothetical protein